MRTSFWLGLAMLASLTTYSHAQDAVAGATVFKKCAACHTIALIDVVVIHRFGVLAVGEPIMQVMTMAPHRADAFQAAEFLMDYLKTDAPFWKKETAAGETRWVASKQEDELARARWSENPAR